MKVAFYDPQKARLVAVDNLSETEVVPVSMYLTTAYSSGRHSLPSPIWLAFDLRGKIRVFFLDLVADFDPDPLLKNIENVVDEYVKKLKRSRGH